MTQPTYNLTNIRELLLQGFDDGELRALCFDMPSFRPVYHQLGSSTGKAEIVARLLEHADKTAKELVEKASQAKPNKSLIKITGEGLKQAAQNLAAVMPPVLAIATQITDEHG